MGKVKVVDAMCGKGKTSWAIQYMNDNVDKKFIYITPFLSEVERVKESCYMRLFKEPDIQKGRGRKLTHFNNLIKNGHNIVSTHAMFKNVNKETIQLLKENNYILIMDEVMSVIEKFNITKDDFGMLLETNRIYIDNETSRIYWNKDKLEYEGEHIAFQNAVLNGDVYHEGGNIIFWTFPVSIFDLFDEVYIMTYLFTGQLQRYYYDLHNIEYEYLSVGRKLGKYVLIPYEDDYGLEYKSLINICENTKLNKIGDISSKARPLSSSWYKKQKTMKSDSLGVLQRNVYNYFKNICKSKSSENMWTTFKDSKSKISGKGYSKSFVSLTSRATNEYKDRKHLAYCINLYMNPTEKAFFSTRGVETNTDMWSLAEMIQWIWRSQIRDGKEINLYIPSERMRKLFQSWLNGNIEQLTLLENKK